MTTIIFVNNHQVLFDDEFAKNLTNIKVSKVGNKFYARSGSSYLHRLVINAKQGEIVDHINGNGLDNRLCNLRIANHHLNKCNSLEKNKTSKYIGVSVHKKRITVQIKIDGKNKHFYGFKTQEEAALFYNKIAKEIHKEFAFQNQI